MSNTLVDIAWGQTTHETILSSGGTAPITLSTYLDNDEGRGRDVGGAVQFNAVTALRDALQRGSEQQPSRVSTDVDVALARAGWPVQRRMLTVFTLNVSTPMLVRVRTNLLPVLCLLSVEQTIHTAVGDKLKEQLKDTLRSTYDIMVEDLASRTTANIRLPYRLRLCADFAILSHMLALTAGSEFHCGPYWWDCLPGSYMSCA